MFVFEHTHKYHVKLEFTWQHSIYWIWPWPDTTMISALTSLVPIWTQEYHGKTAFTSYCLRIKYGCSHYWAKNMYSSSKATVESVSTTLKTRIEYLHQPKQYHKCIWMHLRQQLHRLEHNMDNSEPKVRQPRPSANHLFEPESQCAKNSLPQNYPFIVVHNSCSQWKKQEEIYNDWINSQHDWFRCNCS